MLKDISLLIIGVIIGGLFSFSTLEYFENKKFEISQEHNLKKELRKLSSLLNKYQLDTFKDNYAIATKNNIKEITITYSNINSYNQLLSSSNSSLNKQVTDLLSNFDSIYTIIVFDFLSYDFCKKVNNETKEQCKLTKEILHENEDSLFNCDEYCLIGEFIEDINKIIKN